MSSRYTVRRFRSVDMDRVLEIERASFGKDAWDRKLFAEYGRKCGDVFLVAMHAREAPQIDGYSIACLCEKRRNKSDLAASLESIAVNPRARNQGVASLLLKSTIRRLKLRGVKRITLMVRRSNSTALHFYERRGFTAVRRAPCYYENGEEGMLMRKDLTL